MKIDRKILDWAKENVNLVLIIFASILQLATLLVAIFVSYLGMDYIRPLVFWLGLLFIFTDGIALGFYLGKSGGKN